MEETIITAGVALIGTLVGTFGGICTTARLTSYRLQQLEKQVERHNNVIERTFRLEEALSVHDERIKVANHRIDDLEKHHEREKTNLH